MAGSKTELDDKDVAMLVMLYDNPSSHFTTYSLAQALHPTMDAASQDSVNPFNEVRTTGERLIMLELVKGRRVKANDGGIYFADLELTPKGERRAIEAKHSKIAP